MSPNRLVAIPLLAFCVLWDTFMAVWYGIAIFGRVWLMALVGVLHLGVGIHLTHKALVGLFNTRRLVIDAARVTWKSSPVPERGGVSVPIEQVNGFVAREKQTSNSTTFTVAMNLADGTMHELEVDANDLPVAQYVASSFDEALRLAKQREPEAPYRG